MLELYKDQIKRMDMNIRIPTNNLDIQSEKMDVSLNLRGASLLCDRENLRLSIIANLKLAINYRVAEQEEESTVKFSPVVHYKDPNKDQNDRRKLLQQLEKDYELFRIWLGESRNKY